MLAVIGTVPDPDMGLAEGTVSPAGDRITVSGKSIPVNRGTPALISAALQALSVLGDAGVTGFLAGDTGEGHGSRTLYQYLVDKAPLSAAETVVFHYLQPDVDWHNRVLFMLDEMEKRPVTIADAGFMYAAKMSGQAPFYDLFTPDAGELAFLADETAPHPFYTRGFILHADNKVPELVQRAYENDNAAAYLLVKGARDYIMDRRGEIFTVEAPSAEAMEAVGGTGDTLTGIAAALVHKGFGIPEACRIAAKANRVAGILAEPTPATQICDIVAHIPAALTQVLAEKT